MECFPGGKAALSEKASYTLPLPADNLDIRLSLRFTEVVAIRGKIAAIDCSAYMIRALQLALEE